MRTIETSVRITIRKAIEQHPVVALGLAKDGNKLDNYIEHFSVLTGIEPVFIKQNLQQIRNWL